MYSVGIDLHKETAWYCVFDAQGHRISHGSLPADPECFKKFFEGLPRPFKMAVEATYNWYYVIDIAEEYAAEVYLADSFQTKAFAKKHKKTDKIDARLIAWLLHRGDLPTVAIPDRKTRETREVLRYRMRLVSDRTRDIARLKALLDRIGLKETGDLTTAKRREEIGAIKMPEPYGKIAQGYLTRIARISEELKACGRDLKLLAEQDQDVVHVMSVPGWGSFSALLIKTEIFDISRFRSLGALCAYSGLAPRVHASGGHCYHGPLNTNRRKELQWILLENAWQTMRKIPRLERKYNAIKKRKGSNTAKVAVARDILKIIYHILKEKRPFYPESVRLSA
jgi:transposase